MAGIPLSRPLGIGDRVFADDGCGGLRSAAVAVLVPAPVVSPAGLGGVVVSLLIVALMGLARARGRSYR